MGGRRREDVGAVLAGRGRARLARVREVVDPGAVGGTIHLSAPPEQRSTLTLTLTREDRVIFPVALLGEREGGPGGVVEGSLSRRKDEDRQNPQDLSIAGILVNEGILLFLILLSSRREILQWAQNKTRPNYGHGHLGKSSS